MLRVRISLLRVRILDNLRLSNGNGSSHSCLLCLLLALLPGPGPRARRAEEACKAGDTSNENQDPDHDTRDHAAVTVTALARFVRVAIVLVGVPTIGLLLERTAVAIPPDATVTINKIVVWSTSAAILRSDVPREAKKGKC